MNQTSREIRFGTRRDFLRSGIAASAAAAGMVRAVPALGADSAELTPFTYHAPQSALDDLRQRLTQIRWPERETVDGWSQGALVARRAAP